jgi:hypothetical protein
MHFCMTQWRHGLYGGRDLCLKVTRLPDRGDGESLQRPTAPVFPIPSSGPTLTSIWLIFTRDLTLEMLDQTLDIW